MTMTGLPPPDSPPAASLPQILTRSVLSSLIRDLDAADVLECYSLTRTAPLHNFVEIQKMALGIRYEPPSSSHKQPLELTLEYGPQRTGDWLEYESMPLLLQEDRLSWENEASVYYTTASIHNSLSIHSAYYMASMTGAVLEKILEKAVLYASNKPRYQPFQVYSGGTAAEEHLVLKSSGSVDFMYQMWLDMAELGVDLRPVLEPPLYIPRLYVEDSVHKVSGYTTEGHLVKAQAAQFYGKLQKCWTAVKTGDYSPYESEDDENNESSEDEEHNDEEHKDPTPKPTLAPTPKPTPAPISKPPAAKTTPSPTTSENDSTRRRLGQSWNERWKSRLVTEEEKVVQQQPPAEENSPAPSQAPAPTPTDGLSPTDDADDVFITELQNFDISTSLNETDAPSLAPSSNTDSQAEQAAQEVAQAAQEAQNASTTEMATSAAEHAADAAQKVANVARWQKDAEKLKSVDGTLVTQAMSQCWTNAMYDIRSENDSHVEAYLYLDGNFYYRLNLTSPYMNVVSLQLPVPTPPLATSAIYDDFVDWTLAFCIMGLLGVGIFALIQQMGVRILFHRSQKWFFAPTHHDNPSTHAGGIAGQGRLHGFAEDAIPMSMGGRKPMPFKSELLVTHSPSSQKRIAIGPGGGELEMIETDINSPSTFSSAGSAKRSPSFVSSMGNNGSSSHDSDDAMSDDDSSEPGRFVRHPDMVDMPNLKSHTKTAKPFIIGLGGSSSSINRTKSN